MSENNITITLSVDEWNVVMNALGNRPFAEVSNVISSIQSQASTQVSKEAVDPPVDVGS